VENDGLAFSINARSLAIEHRRFNLQVFSDPSGEFGESTKDVSVSRNQLAFTV
jgi:hypothetical protein